MPIHFLQRASKIYKQLKEAGENVKWPLSKKFVEKFSEEKPQREKTSKKAKKTTNNKTKIYNKAKKLGFKGPYVGTTIKQLEDFIKNPISPTEQYLNFLNDDNAKSIKFTVDEFKSIERLKNKSRSLTRNFKQYIDLIDDKNKLTKTLPLNFNTKNMLEKPTFYNGEIVGIDDSFAQATLTIAKENKLRYITINKNESLTKTNRVNRGAFFPYEIDTSLLVDGYDEDYFEKVKKQYERYVSPKQDNDCLAYTIGLIYPELVNKYKAARVFSNGHEVSLRELPKIAEELSLCIIESHFTGIPGSKQRRTKTYGNPEHPKINIMFYKDHCFLNEETNIDQTSLLKLFGIKYNGIRKTPFSSIEFLRFLVNENSAEGPGNYKCFLRPISSIDSLKCVNTKDLTISGCDEHLLSGSQEIPNYKCKTIEKNGVTYVIPPRYKTYEKLSDTYKVIYFDFETYLTKRNHTVYMCCCKYNDIEKTFIGEDCGKQFLDFINDNFFDDDNIRCIAHNLGYDLSFLIGIKNLEVISRIGNACSNTKASTIKYFNKIIKFMDSKAFLSFKLASFKNELGLEMNYKKGVFPYEAVNKYRVNNNSCNIKTALKYIKPEDKEEFLDCIEPHLIEEAYHNERCIQPTKFRIISYAEEYCKQDCNILQAGFDKFRSIIFELTKLDIFDYVSSPGLALAVVITQNKLEEVPIMSGVARQFIQQTIVGGRNQTANNKIIDDINEEIMDLDVVSLYPTAYKYLEIPQGLPTKIEATNNVYNHTKYFDSIYRWYFLEVEILTVNKPYSIASLSQVDPKTGVRNWEDKPGTYFLNHIQLRDLCKYQQIIYRSKGGLGFDINLPFLKWDDFVDNFANERKRIKKSNPALANVIKTILNSIYGRTLMSPITDGEKIFVDLDDPIIKKKYDIYLNNNFNKITIITPFEGYDKVKCATVQTKKSIYGHEAYNHIASVILATSKSIMNSYIYTCLDNDIKVFYTDTDSMFIPLKDVSKFDKLYTTKYGKSPLGDNLGELQNDYAKACPKDATNIIATKALFVAKKMYSVVLTYDINQEKGTSICTKIKGIPESTINHMVKKLNYNDSFEMLEDIAKGKKIEFDLTCGGKIPRFEVSRDFKFKTLEDFTRTICLE